MLHLADTFNGGRYNLNYISSFYLFLWFLNHCVADMNSPTHGFTVVTLNSLKTNKTSIRYHIPLRGLKDFCKAPAPTPVHLILTYFCSLLLSKLLNLKIFIILLSLLLFFLYFSFFSPIKETTVIKLKLWSDTWNHLLNQPFIHLVWGFPSFFSSNFLSSFWFGTKNVNLKASVGTN